MFSSDMLISDAEGVHSFVDTVQETLEIALVMVTPPRNSLRVISILERINPPHQGAHRLFKFSV